MANGTTLFQKVMEISILDQQEGKKRPSLTVMGTKKEDKLTEPKFIGNHFMKSKSIGVGGAIVASLAVKYPS